jgi:hypothetical protein
MRIQQVNNCEGTNKQGKMAPIVPKMMSIDINLAQELLRRIAWDTAIDMSWDKLNFAEERIVWWKTYNCLELCSAPGRGS